MKLLILAVTLVTALLAVGVSGCSSTPADPVVGMTDMSDRLKAEIGEHVGDPQRRQAALEVAVAFHLESGRVAEQIRLTRENLDHLNRRYDAEPADFDRAMERARRARRELLDVGADAMMELRTLLTREEWRVIHEGVMETAKS